MVCRRMKKKLYTSVIPDYALLFSYIAGFCFSQYRVSTTSGKRNKKESQFCVKQKVKSSHALP